MISITRHLYCYWNSAKKAKSHCQRRERLWSPAYLSSLKKPCRESKGLKQKNWIFNAHSFLLLLSDWNCWTGNGGFRKHKQNNPTVRFFLRPCRAIAEFLQKRFLEGPLLLSLLQSSSHLRGIYAHSYVKRTQIPERERAKEKGPHFRRRRDTIIIVAQMRFLSAFVSTHLNHKDNCVGPDIAVLWKLDSNLPMPPPKELFSGTPWLANKNLG